jgi:hypothetical protein
MVFCLLDLFIDTGLMMVFYLVVIEVLQVLLILVSLDSFELLFLLVLERVMKSHGVPDTDLCFEFDGLAW